MTASAVFGIVLVWASAPVVKRGTERIDRAFFRSAYDARVILQDLAEKARSVTDRNELASLLESKISGALHPNRWRAYLEGEDGLLGAQSRLERRGSEINLTALLRPHFPRRFGAIFLAERRDTIPADLPLLQELARRGKAWDVPLIPETLGDPTPLTRE
jgi:hypothetical protein